ncbi:MAG: acetyltransferase [Alphaproteobacteria bacterium]|nr:acetyltransferase [Alphaproteobacteria bacterium]
MTITFEKATKVHQAAIFDWLKKPHIKEFWDNSQKHKDDILNFMDGRKEPSPYFGGMNTYWIGRMNDIPYAFIISHEENKETNPPAYLTPYLSPSGKTICLDFCIGNVDFFCKGYAASTLTAFMDYFSQEIEPATDIFLIDPYLNNPRAIHVYEKAGFDIMNEFTQDGGYFDQTKGLIMIKRV